MNKERSARSGQGITQPVVGGALAAVSLAPVGLELNTFVGILQSLLKLLVPAS
jgi:hypothetical protein